VEQSDIQEIKNRFSYLLENILTERQADSNEIESLLQKYPYCQPLQILKAVSYKDEGPLAEKYLSRASLYAPNRQILYQIVHHPETIAEKFALSTENASYSFSKDKEEEAEEKELYTSPTIEKEEIETKDTDITIETVIPELEIPETIIEQSVQGNIEDKSVQKGQGLTEGSPIFDTVASSDYFTFDKSSADPLTETAATEEAAADIKTSLIEDESIKSNTSDSISKYNDDKLPYTFLWWLQKTRLEHASTYQPYALSQIDFQKKIKKNSPPELNQQIIENIFHMQVPLKDETAERKQRAQTVEFHLKKNKDESLIDKFIKEEPQIQPPKPEKLDTENKARKSSEDNYDLVSETLAAIYIDQMLYDKAIDTYKKLSLKFPEKSAYFADQIKELQNKIN